MKPAAAFLFLACLLAACVEIDGGAVEISWVIRSEAGSAITDCGCASPSIAKVRLGCCIGDRGRASTAPHPVPEQAQCDFPCARQTGSTPFNIPETHGTERYAGLRRGAWEPTAASCSEVMTPAPILREVVRGQPTEVESMQLVANVRPSAR